VGHPVPPSDDERRPPGAVDRSASPPFTPARLVLASASPQRRALLERLGVEFGVRPQHVEELEAGDPCEVVRENALRKARAARAGAAGAAGMTGTTEPPETVLGCDTVVALHGVIYGKPSDEEAARATLRALSGATHEVLGGVALLAGADERTGVACTEVSFRALTDELIEWYLARGEWRGRAGGYAIQGAGAALVTAVRGDYENVVGLPLALLLEMCPTLLGAGTDVR
jgi:septum formation protein